MEWAKRGVERYGFETFAFIGMATVACGATLMLFLSWPYVVGGTHMVQTQGQALLAAFKTVEYVRPPDANSEDVDYIAAAHLATSSLQVPEVTIVPEGELYIVVTDGCGPYFEGECLQVRSGPGTEFPAIARLRTNMVLMVGKTITNDEGMWYQIVFDEWLRYPDRLKGEWYVAAEYVQEVQSGRVHMTATTSDSSKRVEVSRSAQTLLAFDGDALVYEMTVSTGHDATPTPRGTFTVFKKLPSRYMQGPLPGVSGDVYDLPGVPWNLYFTEQGAVIHGAYWHDAFGEQYSHGCVNLAPADAQTLFNWAEVGMKVVVAD